MPNMMVNGSVTNVVLLVVSLCMAKINPFIVQFASMMFAFHVFKEELDGQIWVICFI